MTTLPALDDWEPLTPREVADLFRAYPGTWAIAGGWAIDLFVGEVTRQHADIDVQVDRAAMELLHAALPGWLLYGAHGDLTLWEQGAPLPAAIHDVWCRRPGRPWQFQLMLGEFTEAEWVYRRDPRITMPRQEAILTIDDLPVLAPEIQLLYKSKRPNRPRDEQDLATALPRLSPTRRDWLAASLRTLHGDHPWLADLEAPATG